MNATRAAGLLRVAGLQEEAARAQVTLASQAVEQQQRLMDGALDALSREALTGGTIGQFRASSERLCRLAQQVGVEQAALEQARDDLVVRTATWQERRQHRHLMEQLHERALAAQLADEHARTQRLVDDLASRRPAGVTS